jgi:hypothetical protein
MVAATGSINEAASARDRVPVGLAALCAVVAFVGFAPTYWVPLARGTLDVPPITHLHAAAFFGWMLLFLAQTMLVAANNRRLHREVGVAGVALATSMVFTGMLMAIRSVETATAAGFEQAARSFSIVSFSALALFAALVTAALLTVRTRPDWHKRLMLLATISLLQAAVGRWFALFLRVPGSLEPPPVSAPLAVGMLTNLLIVAAIVQDWRIRGRVHPAYLVGGACIVAVQVLRAPVAGTAVWHAVVSRLLALAA